jgi:hypothetical protein
MGDFWLWFSTGLQHILDINGYDHICYVAVLTVLFRPQEWRKLLVLTTAFTIGHSLTLALSTLNIVILPQSLIECLIPVTILFTCLFNIITLNNPPKRVTINYSLALIFGLVHGMGFSYLLKSLLGREESITGPLLYFNIGLEAGQIVVVAAILLISVLLRTFTNVKQRDYAFFVSSAVFGVALVLLLEHLNEA